MEIITSTIISKGNGSNVIMCEFNDGSVYHCDEDGTNWVKIKMSFAELKALLLIEMPELGEIAVP